MARLYDYAKVFRSKNSGPFEITVDIIFETQEQYEYIKNKKIITKEVVAEAYKIAIEDIHQLVYFDQGLGIKITMARSVSSGSKFDRDVYGSQQYAPLMNVQV